MNSEIIVLSFTETGISFLGSCQIQKLHFWVQTNSKDEDKKSGKASTTTVCRSAEQTQQNKKMQSKQNHEKQAHSQIKKITHTD